MVVEWRGQALHALREDAPEIPLYVPTGQFLQVVTSLAPSSVLYVPGPHCVHTTADCAIAAPE
jgi:hypothetical protein